MLFVVLLFLAVSSFAQTGNNSKRSVTWKLNNLEKIGGLAVELLGSPQVVKTDRGKAIVFDGVRDGIFIKTNPLAGADKFTIEAIFRPDAGGEKEQRCGVEIRAVV